MEKKMKKNALLFVLSLFLLSCKGGGKQGAGLWEQVSQRADDDTTEVECADHLAPAALEPVEDGEPMTDVTVTDEQGNPVSILACCKGHRRTAVVVWTNVCNSSEMFHKLKKSYTLLYNKGVHVIGLSIDVNKDESLRQAARLQLPWRQYFLPEGLGGSISRLYHVGKTPCLLVFGEDGTYLQGNVSADALWDL